MKAIQLTLVALILAGCATIRGESSRQQLLGMSIMVPRDFTDATGPYTGPVEGEMHREWRSPNGAVLHAKAYPDQLESFLGPVEILGFKPVADSDNVILMRAKLWFRGTDELLTAILVNKTDGYLIFTDSLPSDQFENILRTVRFSNKRSSQPSGRPYGSPAAGSPSGQP